VGKLLGHSQASTTERYALADDPVRQAADVIGKRIEAALAGTAAQVVPLRPRATAASSGVANTCRPRTASTTC
jgi:hypothetical protein